MAHRMAVMQAGRILQTDVPATVFERPADTFVAAFVGVDNLLPATVERAEENRLWLDMAGKRLLAPGTFRPGSQVTLCLRPEHVTISAAESGRNGARPVNAFNGRIVKVTPLSHFAKVQIDCGFPLVALSSQASCWPKGQTVQITIDPSHLHVIGRPGS
jgi:ABC-type Fe3+/spermidine/putrescine transport system ATPase subunit